MCTRISIMHLNTQFFLCHRQNLHLDLEDPFQGELNDGLQLYPVQCCGLHGVILSQALRNPVCDRWQ